AGRLYHTASRRGNSAVLITTQRPPQVFTSGRFVAGAKPVRLEDPRAIEKTSQHGRPPGVKRRLGCVRVFAPDGGVVGVKSVWRCAEDRQVDVNHEPRVCRCWWFTMARRQDASGDVRD